MNTVFHYLKAFASNERGAAAIEYALLAALVSVGAIFALTQIGDGISELFTSVCTSLSEIDGVSISCAS